MEKEKGKRLIDANAVIKEIDNYYNNSPFPHPGASWRRGFEFAAGLVLIAPTVDAVEVVHGRWIPTECGTLCLACHRVFDHDFEVSHYRCLEFKFCPNCGAKMDGE